MKKTVVTVFLVIMTAFYSGFIGLPAFTVFAQAGDAADAAVFDDDEPQAPPGAGPPATDASAFDDEPEKGILGTLLPGTTMSKEQCELKFMEIWQKGEKVTEEEISESGGGGMATFLACSIKTGRISFWMISHYVVYFIEFLVGIAGIVAILFLVIGGFKYVLAGAIESQRESAKATIKNALLGLVVVFISWVVVNTIQFILTF